jgi:hypothetical protein
VFAARLAVTPVAFSEIALAAVVLETSPLLNASFVARWMVNPVSWGMLLQERFKLFAVTAEATGIANGADIVDASHIYPRRERTRRVAACTGDGARLEAGFEVPGLGWHHGREDERGEECEASVCKPMPQ